MRRRATGLLGVLLLLAACSSSGDGGGARDSTPAPAVTTGAPPPTTTDPDDDHRHHRRHHDDPADHGRHRRSRRRPTRPATTPPIVQQQIELGRSVEGRPITAVERGTPGGTAVLVIGCIHGDEDAGMAVVDDLMTDTVPDGVDLWLVPSMNPDGQAHQVRTNAHQVDLNRNFPQNWAPARPAG